MAVPVTKIDPGQTTSEFLAQSAGTGLSSALQGLAQGKVKELQQQKLGTALQQMGQSPEQAQGIAALSQLDPRLAQTMLKQQMTQQQQQQRVPRAEERVQNLQELANKGVGTIASYFGGTDPDTYDLYAKELQKDIQKIYPDAVVPRAKDSSEAKEEGLTRLSERLKKDFGAQQAQAIMGGPAQEISQAMQQQQEAQQPGQEQQLEQQQAPQEQVQQQPPQDEGIVGQALRTGVGAAANAVAPLSALASPVTGAAIGASDLVQNVLQAPLMTQERADDFAKQLEQEKGPEEAQKFRDVYKKNTMGFQPKEREPLKDAKLLNLLPSTKNLKGIVSRALPDGYMEPKSRGESIVQDAVNKGVGLVSFGGMSIPKALTGTASGLAAREFAKNYGAGPIAQTTTEMLFTMMPDLLYNNARYNLSKTAERNYDKFDKSAAARQSLDMEKVVDKAKAIRKAAQADESLPSNRKIADAIEDFEKKMLPNKQMKMADAVDQKRIFGRQLDELNLDKTAKGQLTGLQSDLRNAIHNQGKKLDADGYSFLKRADDIYSGLKASEPLIDRVKDLYNQGKYRSLATYALMGRFPATAGGSIVGRLAGIGAIKGAALGAVGDQLVQTYRFLKQTPGAWKELQKAATDSLKGNTKSAAARLGKFDEKALKWEEKQQKSAKSRARRGI